MSADRTHRNAEIERFFALFRRFGAAPCGELYLAFFDPEATLFNSGMPRPITVPVDGLVGVAKRHDDALRKDKADPA